MADIKEVYEYLDNNEPDIASKICYASEMLLGELDNAIEALKLRRIEATKIDDDTEVDRLRNYRDMLKKYKQDINEYLDYATHHKQPVLSGTPAVGNVRKDIPDYAQYAVNKDVPHMLDEDFTHKRPCGFMFKAQRYDVTSWQELLLSLCEQLSSRYGKSFDPLVNDPRFIGRKVNYFGYSAHGRRNQLIPGTNIYVWINQSADSIVRMIKNILIAFDENPNELYVYLRADYNDLHTDKSEDSEPVEETEKVGKYVKQCMRALEKHTFNKNEILLMQNKDWSNKTFGINYPLLCSDEKRIYDSGGRRRYYKETFIINGKRYYLTSQWFDYNRKRFEKWYQNVTKEA